MNCAASATKVFGLLAVGVWATGCLSGGEAAPSSDVTEESGQLVGSLRLSPTHTVDFIDYGDVARVREIFNADLDRSAPMTLDRMQVGDRPMAEIYALFAANATDAAVVTKLRAIDERIAQASLPFDHVHVAPIALSTATPSAATDGVERQQSALLPASCTEPVWNWAGDATWYQQNFCTGSPAFCGTNSFSKLSWGWDGPLKRFQANVFNQSHCAAQGWWQLLWRNNTGTHQPTNTVICPRCVQSEVWSGGTNVQYLNSMEPREAGKMVSMTIYRTPA
jgi:hypothetical protein